MTEILRDTHLASSRFDKPRVAVLVDGENISHGALSTIENAAKGIGTLSIRRVYGDMTSRKDWEADHSFHAIHTGKGRAKNSADIRLVVDAMDLAHRGLADAFVIASSDSDFAPLAVWLREAGFNVVGVGRQTTAPTFQEACSRFVTLPAPTPIAVPISTVVLKKNEELSHLDRKLHLLLSDNGKGSLGIALVQIGNQMKGDTVQAQTGKPTWRAYFVSKPEMYNVKGTGAATFVTRAST